MMKSHCTSQKKTEHDFSRIKILPIRRFTAHYPIRKTKIPTRPSQNETGLLYTSSYLNSFFYPRTSLERQASETPYKHLAAYQNPPATSHRQPSEDRRSAIANKEMPKHTCSTKPIPFNRRDNRLWLRRLMTANGGDTFSDATPFSVHSKTSSTKWYPKTKRAANGAEAAAKLAGEDPSRRPN